MIVQVAAVDQTFITTRSGAFRRGGIGIRTRLLALVLVALVGAAVFSTEVRSADSSAVGATERITAEVRLIGLLEKAREVAYLEGIRAFILPGVRKIRLPPAALGQYAKNYFLPGYATERASTDAAFHALASVPGGAGLARDLTPALANARSIVDKDKSAALIYQAYSRLGFQVDNDETGVLRTIATHLLGHSSSSNLLGALDQLRSAAALGQAGGQEDLDFTATLVFANLPGADEFRQQLLLQWASYLHDSDNIGSQFSAGVGAFWRRLVADPEIAKFQAGARAVAVEGVTGWTQDLIRSSSTHLTALAAEEEIIIQVFRYGHSASVDVAMLNQLDHLAILEATHAARSDQIAASTRLHQNELLQLILLLSSLIIGLATSLSISRPLGKLAASAERISDGELVDVEVVGPPEVRVVARALEATLLNLRRVQTQAEVVATGRFGAEVLGQPMPGPLGQLLQSSVERMLATIRDREQLQTELAFQAGHDQLTGLANRGSTEHLLEAALSRGQRGGYSVGLLFIDLDHFKRVNDTLGHAAGDAVLRVSATRMRSCVRTGDVVCRLGGDEFVVVAEPVSSERSLVGLANRMIEALSKPMDVAGHEVAVGASIGIAISQDGETEVGKLFSEADAAVYRAKAAGRGVAELFDDGLRRDLQSTLELQEAMEYGLSNNEFVLHYQPVVDVATGMVCGVEALIRWERPGYGLIPPDQFIPVAESCSLINHIGRWVMNTATAQMVAWSQSPAMAVANIAVNISGNHLLHAGVVDDVRDALGASGIDPKRVVIEITETVDINDLAAIGHLSEIKDLGVRIAIDDFGTGYTSISQLQRLPVDVLKIDRSFVSSPELKSPQIVELIVDMAHTLGLTAVAEGVETPGQLEHLQAINCELVQGYHISRPLPAPALLEWCEARATAISSVRS